MQVNLLDIKYNEVVGFLYTNFTMLLGCEYNVTQILNELTIIIFYYYNNPQRHYW